MSQMDLYTRRRQWIGPGTPDAQEGYEQVVGIAIPERPLPIASPDPSGSVQITDPDAAWMFRPQEGDPDKTIRFTELNVISLDVDDTFADRLWAFFSFYGPRAPRWRRVVSQRDFIDGMEISPHENEVNTTNVVAANTGSERTLAIGEYAVVSYTNKITRLTSLHLLLGIGAASTNCLHLMKSGGYLGIESINAATERHTARAHDHPHIYTQPTMSTGRL